MRRERSSHRDGGNLVSEGVTLYGLVLIWFQQFIDSSFSGIATLALAAVGSYSPGCCSDGGAGRSGWRQFRLQNSERDLAVPRRRSLARYTVAMPPAIASERTTTVRQSCFMNRLIACGTRSGTGGRQISTHRVSGGPLGKPNRPSTLPDTAWSTCSAASAFRTSAGADVTSARTHREKRIVRLVRLPVPHPGAGRRRRFGS